MKSVTSIDKYRLMASRLQKTTKQSLTEDPSSAALEEIVQRFRRMGELATDSESAALRRLGAFSLTKYLDLIAYEEGRGNWAELTQQLREQDKSLDDAEDTELYKFNASEFNLNVWCPSYEEAKAYLDSHRGFYLLQYKGQCFLAQAPHIVDLGLDPKDPDWEKIGRDWVQPKDPEAKTRLRQKLQQARERAAS
ncbi:hypothetical protein OOT46_11735 [Aquabacterium sp. A7-Y]|uniref:hypothetical protein n=1 Tax=Aquabacterium sp. A7-Y TaxID=1349605 RepID=UPI00223C8EA8|nr:hypothetical protein [Aquabacterium sp. A7-Y]MCW7538512.1 hypothetical protein [Aquabacterium sp. A7-Y]